VKLKNLLIIFLVLESVVTVKDELVKYDDDFQSGKIKMKLWILGNRRGLMIDNII
jgi:hypothetical protein